MDPLTQGVVGTTASQLLASPKQKVSASVLGFLSGMAADMDVLIQSNHDPLLSLEYHRHFTHALVFIPLGALLCALLFFAVIRVLDKKNKTPGLSFKAVYLFCFMGYATHALLDACTTYGTQLLWPFSDMRVAWNTVSVIDPLFTLPILFCVAFAILKKSKRFTYFAAIYGISYLLLGAVQGQRAELVAQSLAALRGHQAIALGVKPSFANILLWKSVYEYDGRYYVDAIRAGFDSKIYDGTSTAKLDVETHFAWLDSESQQAIDIERFRWFSNGHLGVDPDNSNRIIDIRYSLIPNRLDGMWGIILDEQAAPKQHIVWDESKRPEKSQYKVFFRMLAGRDISKSD